MMKSMQYQSFQKSTAQVVVEAYTKSLQIVGFGFIYGTLALNN